MRHVSGGCRRNRGFTLVEMLVAMAITLVLIFALAQAFALIGESVAQGRAAIEMSNNLRAVTHRLDEDLQGITLPVRPPADETAGTTGYLEIIDGSSQDKDAVGTAETALGDIDDILALTTARSGAPFVGTVVDATGNQIAIESPTAEVVWWIQYEDRNASGSRDLDEPYTIYRRALLIRPDLDFNQPPFSLVNGSYANLNALMTEVLGFLNNNDVSVQVRVTGSGPYQLLVKPNSLADLTLRENRFAHFTGDPTTTVFPFPLNTTLLPGLTLRQRQIQRLTTAGVTLPDRTGEDVIVSNALAFDVQVFDPAAPVMASANTGEALAPSDPGYWPAVLAVQNPPLSTPPTNLLGLGAFVDLGYGHRYKVPNPPGPPVASNAANWSRFAGAPAAKSGLSSYGYCYCTWAQYYERNGVDEDDGGSGLVDEGTNGLDDDSQNGVDDAGELETSPPYPTPLRGIQVRIRVWDPDSRQLRQSTVAADFVPE